MALTAGKGGSRKTERWLSPPGPGALRGRNIQFASALHDNRLCTDNETMQNIVADFAHSQISSRDISTILYPDPYRNMTLHEVQEMERKLTDVYAHDLPNFNGGFIPFLVIDPEEYENDCAVPTSMLDESRSRHREQAYNFLIESLRRKDNTE